MATLVTLPRELRDQILALALFSRDPAPASPSAAARDRHCNDRMSIFPVESEPQVRADALLCTSKQLRAETQDCLASPSSGGGGLALTYHLDILFVKGSGLWPTWLSIPRRAQHVDVVRAQFRLRDLPADLPPAWRRPDWWRGGDGGPPGATWDFYALLSWFLEMGPAGPTQRSRRGTSNGERTRARYSIGRLVMDVQLMAEGEEDVGILVPSFGGREHPAFGGGLWYVVRREDGRLEKVRSEEETDPRRLPAEKLAFFLSHMLDMLLGMGRHSIEYGKVLYEGLGVIEVRVDGEPRWVTDLGARIRRFPLGYAGGTEFQEQRTAEFAAWRDETEAIRRLRGLDQVPDTSREVLFDSYSHPMARRTYDE